MNAPDIDQLVTSRLEDMANQVALLYARGDYAEAELVGAEGLNLASAYDLGTTFMYLPDYTNR